MGERLLLVKEVAEIFRRSEKTIYRWVDQGVLQPRRVLGGLLIPESQLENIPKRRKRTAHRFPSFPVKP